MSTVSTLSILLKFQLIQYEVEAAVLRVLDPMAVTEQLISKGVSEISIEKVLQHLDEDFLSRFPKFSERLILDETLIPPNVPIFISKKRYKINGEIWVVHMNDVDPFPSSPHAHNYDQKLVMHLGSGAMYRERKYVATINKRKFLKLREMITSVNLPPLEITPD